MVTFMVSECTKITIEFDENEHLHSVTKNWDQIQSAFYISWLQIQPYDHNKKRDLHIGNPSTKWTQYSKKGECPYKIWTTPDFHCGLRPNQDERGHATELLPFYQKSSH